MKSWLKFFRIVNLPTVPGDVLVGVSGALAACGAAEGLQPRRIVASCAASCFIYLYGLADNDIVGAKTDSNRPIPRGEISLGAARLARALCLVAVGAIAACGGLPSLWWPVACALLVISVVYNRTKIAPLMGLCRALNVMLGIATLSFARFSPVCLVPVLVWFLYVWWVTNVSEGEETDPRKKQTVGILIGGLVYLQLVALLVLALVVPVTNYLLLAGAVLLIVLRVVKRLLPGVSAS